MDNNLKNNIEAYDNILEEDFQAHPPDAIPSNLSRSAPNLNENKISVDNYTKRKIKPFYRIKGKYANDGKKPRNKIVIELPDGKTKTLPKPEKMLKILGQVKNS